MATSAREGQISLAGLGLVSVGAVLIWAAINDPPGGLAGAFRELLKGKMPTPSPERLPKVAEPSRNGPSANAPASGAGGASRGKVISVAESYLGDPYVFGGASHRGIDCSGLVLVAYRDGAGISLPHKATAQCARGTRIEATDVQAGDLVAWGVPGNYPHIALALNQTECIAAWTYGVGVKVDKIHQKAVAGFGYPDFYRIL